MVALLLSVFLGVYRNQTSVIDLQETATGP
jgi:hypothetical protein